MKINNVEKFAELNAILNFLIYECKINSLCKISFLALSIYDNNFKLPSLIGGTNKYELIQKLIKYTNIKELSLNEDYTYILNNLKILQDCNYIEINEGIITIKKDTVYHDYNNCKYLTSELKYSLLKEINSFSDESFLSEVIKYA